MKEAFIFDMDGLLMDSEPLWKTAEIKCFKEVGVHLSVADCEKTMGLRIDEVVNYWQGIYPDKISPHDAEQLPGKIVELMKELILEQAEPMPGAVELIDYAVKRDIPRAIASSSYPELIAACTKKFGFEQKIKVTVSAMEVEYGKPHPDVFLRAAQKLNVPPEGCIVFEDSVNGVIAAKAAKMTCIAIPDETDFHNPNFSIADKKLSSLTEFLKEYQSTYDKRKNRI